MKQKRCGETEGATEVGVTREGEKQKRVLLDGKKKIQFKGQMKEKNIGSP